MAGGRNPTHHSQTSAFCVGIALQQHFTGPSLHWIQKTAPGFACSRRELDSSRSTLTVSPILSGQLSISCQSAHCGLLKRDRSLLALRADPCCAKRGPLLSNQRMDFLNTANTASAAASLGVPASRWRRAGMRGSAASCAARAGVSSSRRPSALARFSAVHSSWINSG